MPGYKATVTGENFEFVVDDETQYLDFTRTVYIDAADEAAAQEAALATVREELLAQSLLNESSNQVINIDEINQTDILAKSDQHNDFVWYFPDDGLFDDED